MPGSQLLGLDGENVAGDFIRVLFAQVADVVQRKLIGGQDERLRVPQVFQVFGGQKQVSESVETGAYTTCSVRFPSGEKMMSETCSYFPTGVPESSSA